MQVRGNTDNVELLRMLRPAVIIPLMNAEFDASGPLAELIKVGRQVLWDTLLQVSCSVDRHGRA
jgi:hypothetical protein